MASSLNAFYNSKDQDYDEFYSSLGIPASRPSGINSSNMAKPAAANASIREQRREQLAQAAKSSASKSAAKSSPSYIDTPTGRVYIPTGSYNPNADQSRLLPQGDLRPNGWTDPNATPARGTILGGLIAPFPASVDARLKARSDAQNRAFELAQKRNQNLNITVRGGNNAVAGGGGGGGRAPAAPPQPATIKGSATGTSYTVGQTYQSGGYLYRAERDGSFTNLGAAGSGSSADRYAAANSGPGSVSAMEQQHSGRPAGSYTDSRERSGTGSLW